jgi:pimeloyl-ACP methyl ester carboxylesterase
MNELRVAANGVELQVRDHDHPGDTVVFLHFSGANLMMWERALPCFLDRYRVLLVDLRGHGKSEVPGSGYLMDEMARDVIGVMQQLGIKRAHVVGSSLGAEVGLAMAANHGDRVDSLACDGALYGEYGPYGTWEGTEDGYREHVTHLLEKMRGAPEAAFPSVDALVEHSRSRLATLGWWNADVEAMERYGARRSGDGSYRKSFSKAARLDYMEHYYQYRLEDYYRRITCPLLMLPESDDVENGSVKDAMEGLRCLAARARIEVVRGWVHPYGWLTDSDAMCRAVRRFLDRTTS